MVLTMTMTGFDSAQPDNITFRFSLSNDKMFSLKKKGCLRDKTAFLFF
jgi:hypothetical protein